MESTNTSREGSSLNIGERLCAIFIPCIGLAEALVFNLASCFHRPPPPRLRCNFDDIVRLANRSPFSVNDVEALYELYKKLSSSIIDDGLIHKEELRLALFQAQPSENLFLDRVNFVATMFPCFLL